MSKHSHPKVSAVHGTSDMVYVLNQLASQALRAAERVQGGFFNAAARREKAYWHRVADRLVRCSEQIVEMSQ